MSYSSKLWGKKEMQLLNNAFILLIHFLLYKKKQWWKFKTESTLTHLSSVCRSGGIGSLIRRVVLGQSWAKTEASTPFLADVDYRGVKWHNVVGLWLYSLNMPVMEPSICQWSVAFSSKSRPHGHIDELWWQPYNTTSWASELWEYVRDDGIEMVCWD